jgi:hypothetical protein
MEIELLQFGWQLRLFPTLIGRYDVGMAAISGVHDNELVCTEALVRPVQEL